MSLARAVFDKYPEAVYALPMIDARRKEVYTALYDRTLTPVWPVSSAILEESFFAEKVPEEVIIYSCGDGSLKIGDSVPAGIQLKIDPEIMCSARHLVNPALDLWAVGLVDDPLHFVPYYLKPPNITQPRNMAPEGR
jgi:tRNA threonylcarbamoyladenosine biosynthesis protein TsaB